MASPDYVLCLECDTPVYVFEWRDGEIKEALCPSCGNEELDHFAAPDEIEELEQSWSARRQGQRTYYPRAGGQQPRGGRGQR
jgi:hypothetical protein